MSSSRYAARPTWPMSPPTVRGLCGGDAVGAAVCKRRRRRGRRTRSSDGAGPIAHRFAAVCAAADLEPLPRRADRHRRTPVLALRNQPRLSESARAETDHGREAAGKRMVETPGRKSPAPRRPHVRTLSRTDPPVSRRRAPGRATRAGQGRSPTTTPAGVRPPARLTELQPPHGSAGGEAPRLSAGARRDGGSTSPARIQRGTRDRTGHRPREQQGGRT